MSTRKHIPATLLFFFLYSICFSQTINSPYSSQDIGKVSGQGFSQNKAMGGTSIGIRSYNYINPFNPASYTSQDTNTFLFDVGMIGRSSNLKTNNEEASETYLNLNNLSMGFPVTKWWKVSMGVSPYSRIGYLLSYTQQDVNGYDEVEKNYKGEGGVNRFYLGNAFMIGNKLSLGVNLLYNFGRIEHDTLNRYYTNDNIEAEIQRERETIINSLLFEVGFQYHDNLTQNWHYTIGGIFGNEYSSKAVQKYTKQKSFPVNDTLLHRNEQERTIDFPLVYGGGIALKYKNKWLWGLDYTREKWGSLSNKGLFGTLKDRTAINAGVEFIPEKTSLKYYWKRIRYRMGVFYENSRIERRNKQLSQRGLSIGLGLPLKYSNTTFNITYEFSKFGTTNNNFIEENTHSIYFNISFHDIWFIDPKIK